MSAKFRINHQLICSRCTTFHSKFEVRRPVTNWPTTSVHRFWTIGSSNLEPWTIGILWQYLAEKWETLDYIDTASRNPHIIYYIICSVWMFKRYLGLRLCDTDVPFLSKFCMIIMIKSISLTISARQSLITNNGLVQHYLNWLPGKQLVHSETTIYSSYSSKI
jgi:hypothetical protein